MFFFNWHRKLGFCNSFPSVRTTPRYHERKCVSSCWCMLIDLIDSWWLLHVQLHHETVRNFRTGSFIVIKTQNCWLSCPWMYKSYTLKTTPGPSSPSTSARCILAHHRPTTSQKNMLRSYKSSSFFSKSDGCFVFHDNHVTTSGKDFWEFVAWKYPGPQGSSWKYPGDLNRSGRWSWGSQWRKTSRV